MSQDNFYLNFLERNWVQRKFHFEEMNDIRVSFYTFWKKQ